MLSPASALSNIAIIFLILFELRLSELDEQSLEVILQLLISDFPLNSFPLSHLEFAVLEQISHIIN